MQSLLSIVFCQSYCIHILKESPMNRVPLARRVQIINCLVEGNSIRSMERMTGTHRDTICRLLVEVGAGCAQLMDAPQLKRLARLRHLEAGPALDMADQCAQIVVRRAREHRVLVDQTRRLAD